MPATKQEDRRQTTVDIVALFMSMMHDLERGALQTAADAQRELADRGVVVRVRRRSRTRGGCR